MKLSISNNYDKVTIREGGHCDMHGLIDRFRKLLLALGYKAEDIDKHIVGVEISTPTHEDVDLPF